MKQHRKNESQIIRLNNDDKWKKVVLIMGIVGYIRKDGDE